MNKKVIAFAIAIVSLFILCTGLIIGIEYIKNENTYFIFKNLIIISYTLTSLLTIIGLIKYFNPISIILIIFHCICLFGQLYFIPYRLYYKILTLTSIITILYTIIILIIKIFKKINIKQRLNVPLLNAILPTIIILATYFMKTFYLIDTVEIISNNILSKSIIIGTCVAVLALIIYIVLRKNRSNKKSYFGAMLGVILGTLIISSFLVLLLVFLGVCINAPVFAVEGNLLRNADFSVQKRVSLTPNWF